MSSSNSSNSVKTSSGSRVSKILTSWKDFFTGNIAAIVFIVIVLLFILVILWIIFNMKNKQLSNVEFIVSPIKLDALSSPVEIASTDLPKTTVGREYSYSFWTYVDKFNPSLVNGLNDTMVDEVTVPRDTLIFYRGSSGNVATANPIVFMDGETNKLYIAIKTEGTQMKTNFPINKTFSKDRKERILNMFDANVNLAAIRNTNYFLNKDLSIEDEFINKYIILTIDYIPLQRWVNITFVIDNKICTVFMDGEIYSVKSTEEYKSMRGKELNIRGQPIDVNLIVDKTDGNIFVGKNAKISGGATPDSYFSRLRFFNYGITLPDVRKIYDQGPVGGSKLFGWQGTSYGIRSPVYKIGT